MKLKSILALAMAVVIIIGLAVGCGNNNNNDSSTNDKAPSDNTANDDTETDATVSDEEEVTASGEGKVYYLNFKPENADDMLDIAAAFTADTGIQMEVMTAAAGSYESTLKSEIAKTEAPTLFHINGINGYESWKDYCADLSGTSFYSYLTDTDLTVSTDDGVFGIATTVEGYGIITNKAIIEAYTETDGAVINSVEDINNFETLKAVAEDMQAKKDDLGIEGAFGSTSLSAGEGWRWQTHLFNLPLYYEYKEKDIDDTNELEGLYLDNYKNIFDLYINNSSTEPGLLSSKTVEDSMSEFALGQVAFIQNGDWGWGSIEGYEVDEDDIMFLPIYVGVDGEEDQGLCVGTENYWSINSQASEEDQAATLEFIDWLFTTDKGKDYVINTLGWTAPFNTFGEDEAPSNPLAKSILAYSEAGKTVVEWVFETMPSQAYKDSIEAALLEYAQGTDDWDNVESTIIEGWASEKENPTEE